MQQLPHPEEEVSVTSPDEVHDTLSVQKKLCVYQRYKGAKRKIGRKIKALSVREKDLGQIIVLIAENKKKFTMVFLSLSLCLL